MNDRSPFRGESHLGKKMGMEKEVKEEKIKINNTGWGVQGCSMLLAPYWPKWQTPTPTDLQCTLVPHRATVTCLILIPYVLAGLAAATLLQHQWGLSSCHSPGSSPTSPTHQGNCTSWTNYLLSLLREIFGSLHWSAVRTTKQMQEPNGS